MKQLYLAFFTSLLLAYPAFAADRVYTVDPAQSALEWTGEKVTGSHHGTVQLKDGKVTVHDGQVVSGTFEIIMSSIVVIDIKDPKYNQKLTNHLKSEDFFSVDQFPVSTFTVTKVEQKKGETGTNAEVSGDLSIKGITLPLAFPATITINQKEATADAETKVDRTKYNVRYGSGRFFENLGDKLIYDEFTVKLHLVAKE